MVSKDFTAPFCVSIIFLLCFSALMSLSLKEIKQDIIDLEALVTEVSYEAVGCKHWKLIKKEKINEVN